MADLNLFVVPTSYTGLPRTAYVHPRFEPGGVDMNALELNGADLADMRGYAGRWVVPADRTPFEVD